MFTKFKNNNSINLIIYVDDIVIIDNNNNKIRVLKEQLQDNFLLKDLVQLSYFLGIEVFR